MHLDGKQSLRLVETDHAQTRAAGAGRKDEQGLWRLSNSSSSRPSQASRQAPVEPGTQKMKARRPARQRPATASLPRRPIAGSSGGTHREPVHLAPQQRPHRLGRVVARGKAGAAGGEDDLDRGSASHSCNCARMAAMSSVTMARASRVWSAPVRRSASRAPDVSVSACACRKWSAPPCPADRMAAMDQYRQGSSSDRGKVRGRPAVALVQAVGRGLGGGQRGDPGDQFVLLTVGL